MKTMCSLFLCTLSWLSNANEREFEIMEILVPKQPLAITGAGQAVSDLDDQLNYSLNRTIADQLSTLVGVNLTGQGGQFQSYSIRGFSRGRIRTEIDGIPIITDRRAGNSVSFIAPELFSLGHVVKGPSSALYGAQALGGVVSLSTEASDKTQLSVSGQSAGNGIGIVVNHQAHDFTSAFAYQHGNNDQAVNGETLHTRFERVSGLLRYKSSRDGITTTASWLPSYGKDIGKSSRKFPTKQVSSYPKELHSLAQIQMNAGQRWTAKLFHHYQNWDSKTLRLERYDGLTQYQSHTLGGQWLQQVMIDDLQTHWGVDWLSRKGVKITSDYRLFNSDMSANNERVSNEMLGKEDNLGLYAKSDWRWRDTQFDVGLRYDWMKQHNQQAHSAVDSQLNASFAVSHSLSDQLTVGLDIGSGFRYPTLTERFFYGKTPRGLIKGKQGLKPESSLGSQLTMTWFPIEQIRLHSAVYNYQLDNYIQRYAANDEQLSYQNLDTADLHGFETELKWYQNDITEHTLSYQQQAGQDSSGQRLAGLHPRKLTWSMLLTFEDWALVNAYRHYFSANSVGHDEQTRNSFTIWDLSLEYQLNDKQTVSLSANNITNKEHYASLDEDAPFQPERSYKLSTSWQF
ncbi:iron complex outermembrane recepter protein [Pseudoalteromonas citrea]|uniref:Iron complex outermembrane recepter protein n=2 Tax=Pseudoalteromonas citrea TaxID=43655 RepID=A0AAD4FSS9_9GAMM|nr:TonB-dependent receptor [Pseudoalteromonas citrea]KAF7773843.1 iron complex outermembrane recepter protein [Pseudoalteromonas citrea]